MEKLKKELVGFNDKGLPRFAGKMAEAIEAMLSGFCEQDERFSKAVEESTKTLTDCVRAVLAGYPRVISDAEAYRKAAEFYFPGAKVDIKCVIVLPQEKNGRVLPPLKTANEERQEDVISVSLLDLLD